jgi:hypothetical protein
MVVQYVLRFKIRFSDTWEAQIQAIKSFMDRNEVATTKVGHEIGGPGEFGAYRIDIGALSSVLKAGKAMLPHCVKKAEDLRIMIDYLEGRVTGNQAIERLNAEVRIGRRSGYIREPTLPYTRVDGLRIKQLENARKARAAYAVNVSVETQLRIREDHKELKLGHILLSRKYGYTVKVIRRILGER